jgi:hypothetical protein
MGKQPRGVAVIDGGRIGRLWGSRQVGERGVGEWGSGGVGRLRSRRGAVSDGCKGSHLQHMLRNEELPEAGVCKGSGHGRFLRLRHRAHRVTSGPRGRAQLKNGHTPTAPIGGACMIWMTDIKPPRTCTAYPYSLPSSLLGQRFTHLQIRGALLESHHHDQAVLVGLQ